MRLQGDKVIRDDGVILLCQPRVFHAATVADMVEKRKAIEQAAAESSLGFGLYHTDANGEADFYLDADQGVILSRALHSLYQEGNHLFVVGLTAGQFYVMRTINGFMQTAALITEANLLSHVAFELERDALYTLHYSASVTAVLGEPRTAGGPLPPERIDSTPVELPEDYLDTIEVTNEWQLEDVTPLLAQLKPGFPGWLAALIAIFVFGGIGYYAYTTWADSQKLNAQRNVKQHVQTDSLAGYKNLWVTIPAATDVLTLYQRDSDALLAGLGNWYPSELQSDAKTGMQIIHMTSFGGENIELVNWVKKHPEYTLNVTPDGMNLIVTPTVVATQAPQLHPVIPTALMLMDRLIHEGFNQTAITDKPQTFGGYSSIGVRVTLANDDMSSLGVIARQIAGMPVQLSALDIQEGDQKMSGSVTLTVYGLP